MKQFNFLAIGLMATSLAGASRVALYSLDGSAASSHFGQNGDVEKDGNTQSGSLADFSNEDGSKSLDSVASEFYPTWNEDGKAYYIGYGHGKAWGKCLAMASLMDVLSNDEVKILPKNMLSGRHRYQDVCSGKRDQDKSLMSPSIEFSAEAAQPVLLSTVSFKDLSDVSADVACINAATRLNAMTPNNGSILIRARCNGSTLSGKAISADFLRSHPDAMVAAAQQYAISSSNDCAEQADRLNEELSKGKTLLARAICTSGKLEVVVLPVHHLVQDEKSASPLEDSKLDAVLDAIDQGVRSAQDQEGSEQPFRDEPVEDPSITAPDATPVDETAPIEEAPVDQETTESGDEGAPSEEPVTE